MFEVQKNGKGTNVVHDIPRGSPLRISGDRDADSRPLLEP
jgi:hypothetical protein